VAGLKVKHSYFAVVGHDGKLIDRDLLIWAKWSHVEGEKANTKSPYCSLAAAKTLLGETRKGAKKEEEAPIEEWNSGSPQPFPKPSKWRL
jgi:hypothetical protein